MIKILILTGDKVKWGRFLRRMINFDKMYENNNCFYLENRLFCFHIRSSFPESLRGAAYSHVILDEEIDDETFCRLLLPTIKQKVTQYGSRHILGER